MRQQLGGAYNVSSGFGWICFGIWIGVIAVGLAPETSGASLIGILPALTMIGWGTIEAWYGYTHIQEAWKSDDEE